MKPVAIGETTRRRLLKLLTTRHDSALRQTERITHLIFDQPTEEARVAVLENAIAWCGLPYDPERAPNTEPPRMKPRTQAVFTERIFAMLGANIDCCAAFNGMDANTAAWNVWRQLKKIEDVLDVVDGQTDHQGAAIWLHAILHNPAHTPYADVTHQFAPWDAAAEAPSIFVGNPELFAEFMTQMRSAKDYAQISRWLTRVPCELEDREVLILSALEWARAAGEAETARPKTIQDIIDLYGPEIASDMLGGD